MQREEAISVWQSGWLARAALAALATRDVKRASVDGSDMQGDVLAYASEVPPATLYGWSSRRTASLAHFPHLEHLLFNTVTPGCCRSRPDAGPLVSQAACCTATETSMLHLLPPCLFDQMTDIDVHGYPPSPPTFTNLHSHSHNSHNQAMGLC
jgi:hypothetical protein